ncbi:MAG: hypothetical protein GY756_12300 [bacterium]|nr:hypothetical protein [bacterium]
MDDCFNDIKFPKRKNLTHNPFYRNNNSPSIFFITVCSKDRKNIFARDETVQLIIKIWSSADYWQVGKYMVMPDHVHLFCINANLKYPDLSSWIQYWKSLISKKWPYKNDFPIWQNGFWDTRLRSIEHYSRKWEYIKNNPVNHGFVNSANDWPYHGEINIFHL